MSGLYIPGMEMPKSCDGCEFATHYERYGKEDYCQFMGWYADYEKCPLVAAPDHGRLIDADAAIEDIHYEILEIQMNGMKGTPMYVDDLRTMWKRLGDEELVPTVIPAEKECASAL